MARRILLQSRIVALIDAGGRKVLLSYSTNVHRTESLQDVRKFLWETTIPLKARLFPDREMGLELRIGSALLRELAGERALQGLKDDLGGAGLFVFSVNGYPLGDFQAPVVKRAAYEPPWPSRERVEATKGMARILAALLPEGMAGTISTLAGGYHDRPASGEPSGAALDALAEGYAEAAAECAGLYDRTGGEIGLCIEPEPWTTIETADGFSRFYEEHLLRAGAERFRSIVGASPAEAEADLRSIVLANLDTCHHAVMFEGPDAAIARLEAAGIAVGKVHLSSALALPDPGRNREVLRRLDEPRFMHQVVGSNASGQTRPLGEDIPVALDSAGRLDRLAECRVHFHVPLDLEPPPPLRTTAAAAEAALRRMTGSCKGSEPPLPVVVETYTWSVLPDPARPPGRPDLVTGLEGEFRWALERLRGECSPGSPRAGSPGAGHPPGPSP